MNQSSSRIRPTRRTVLAGGLGASALAALPAAATAAGLQGPQQWSGSTSANGWAITSSFETVVIEGTGTSVPLRSGAPAVILAHLARRFHYEIDELREGDLFGGSTDRRVGIPEQSNHLSGTALAIRRGSFPAGQRGNLFPDQLVVVRDMVAECEGVVRWGGDLSVPLESHFLIDLPSGDRRVAQLAARFGRVDAFDGAQGAGAIDAFTPARRASAARFQHQQRG